MSNKKETDTNNKKILTRSNEEETTTLEIDDISELGVNKTNMQINIPKNNECSNNDLNKNVIQNLDIELENIMVKSNKMDQECTVFQLDEKYQKTPSIWVQYNQMYDKRTLHQRFYEIFHGAPLSNEPESRNAFIKLVFILLFVILSITATFGIIVLNTQPLKEFYQYAGLFLIVSSMFLLFVTNYVTTYYNLIAYAREPPYNAIPLVVAVIAMSNIVAAVTVRFRTDFVILAVIAIMITVFFCILLACSSFDFTAWYIYVVVVVMVFMAFSMIASITILAMGMKFRILKMVLLFISTLLQVIVFIFELQLILGDCRCGSIEIEEEDYALAAYMLYTSIIDMFLHIVQIIGIADE